MGKNCNGVIPCELSVPNNIIRLEFSIEITLKQASNAKFI